MKRMLVDATHPEETRVAIVNTNRGDYHKLDDYDYALASKPILRGNIYLAKVMRIEPSLQAAFVEYGGNRHGFLPFSEIHPDYYRIPMADRPADAEDDEDLGSLESGDTESGYDEGEAEHEADAVQPSEHHEDEVLAADQQELAPESTYNTLAETAGDPTLAAPPSPLLPATDDNAIGLITDFGNAVLPGSSITEVAIPEQAPETVGGEMTERFVRKSRPRYKIQEVIKRGQVMLVQAVKEERGNKGAALTTYLSLAGRYAVLMPNSENGGGVSRKITNHQDRRRMKEILDQLQIPEGMGIILRTAGMQQEPPEIQRDAEYLLRLWDNIREQTLQSTAPALIYEEANLIKRSVRDLYAQNIEEILVAGEEGYHRARDFMRAIMPDEVEKIKLYTDPVPLFFRYHVENQIDALHNPTVQLRSGGYIVINPTEALVAIDVNSGRATRERHIEETAVKTNLEAAEEIARQLRLRDLAGLIVIDFIDMEDGRNNAAVERRLKDGMRSDRARLQIGRISPFGLLELSRQRLRPSLLEINFEKCPHCAGVGLVRSVDSAALSILRAIEEEGIRQRNAELIVHVPTKIALYILNQKRPTLSQIEQRYDLHVLLHSDDTLVPPNYRLERLRNRGARPSGPAVNVDQVFADTEQRIMAPSTAMDDTISDEANDNFGNRGHVEEVSGEFNRPRSENRGQNSGRQRRYRPNDNRRRGHQGGQPENIDNAALAQSIPNDVMELDEADGLQPLDNGSTPNGLNGDSDQQRRRRRGRRGGRRRFGQNGRDGAPDGRPDQPQGNRDRAPRDQNGYRPRHERQPYNGDAAASMPSGDVVTTEIRQPAAPVFIPTSIHEIDTTPKVARTQPELPRPTNFETINPPSDKPKMGWWKRLTGGE